MLEAKAWVRKYFKDASDEKRLLALIEIGINERRLISKPIQILNHEEEEILIKVPKINVRINKIL